MSEEFVRNLFDQWERVWHEAQHSGRLLRCGISVRPYDGFGSKAEKLRMSKCFPVYPRKRTSDLRSLNRLFPARPSLLMGGLVSPEPS